jgi:NitT/TauT family transport system ATP-binding protein
LSETKETTQADTLGGPEIELHGVSVRFGDGQSALSDLTLNFQKGEFVSVVGPSGCGKSTLLRVIAGLQRPTAGIVQVGGDVSSAYQWQTGFVFQQPTLLPWRRLLDNIALPLELRGMSREKRRDEARRVCALVGLSVDDEAKLPRMLSGGMRMRVSLARTLVTHPKVMLLDEPLAAIDDILRNELLVELAELWRQRQWTTVLVTHNVAEAVFISQRVVVMSPQPGRIVDELPIPFEYPRRPELRATARFAELTGRVAAALHAAGRETAM